MGIPEYEAEIAQLRPVEAALRVQLETLCQQYLEATQQFLAEWYKKTIERAVASKPDVTVKLSADGQLTSLKNELGELVANLPQLVDAELGADSYWSHRRELPKYDKHNSTKWYEQERRYSIYRTNSVPDVLLFPIQKLLGYAGALLIKYKYTPDVHSGDREKEWVREYGSEKVRYGYGISASNDMGVTMQQYSKLYEELLKKSKRIQDLEELIASTNAKNLWDAT